jgi:protocatechuate 3,4-dioxygenase beta subunit
MRRVAVMLAAGAVLALGVGCTRAAPVGPARAEATAPTTSSPSAATAACRPTPGGVDGPAAAPPDTPSRVRLGPGRQVKRTAETIAISRRGEPLLVTGVVYAMDCRTPLSGATIDAWQTNAEGAYGPSRSSSSAGADCCFLQGHVRTDRMGRYALDTVVPGRYAEGNPPPRHIHIAVSHPDARNLVTEMMFAGDPGVPPNDPLAVTPVMEGRTLHVVFDVVLQRA